MGEGKTGDVKQVKCVCSGEVQVKANPSGESVLGEANSGGRKVGGVGDNV